MADLIRDEAELQSILHRGDRHQLRFLRRGPAGDEPIRIDSPTSRLDHSGEWERMADSLRTAWAERDALRQELTAERNHRARTREASDVIAAENACMKAVYDAAVKWHSVRGGNSLGLFYAAQGHLVAVISHAEQMREAPCGKRK